ncbi:MAG: NADH:ubiquinone reductase (Na(+)-transporting) subunit B [Prevotellaceae bacterium]|nr:NADH:ubiquinone reductase (Na(+)-transporting) subunit B [Prevotellaceae bacterium]MDY3856324.1 NADH:ubiquinone reductase (Na(+)-transporting) subunit B [Bacteroidaceae bacterium]
MNSIQNFFDKIRPTFDKGGKLHALHSVYEGFESFLLVSNKTSRNGVSIHDAIDSKRIMSFVVIALMPAMLFGMYNIGYQNYAAAGITGSFWQLFGYGFLVMLPRIIVSYVVGLGIEFIFAQVNHEEIQEGYLVTGLLIPLILPVETPLWMMALAIAFSVILAKELWGGTGMNVFNVALVARAFLFFSYPSKMTGDSVWVANGSICGLGNDLPDTFTQATPLSFVKQGATIPDMSVCDMITGLIPGSVGETSVIAIAIGAVILLWTGIASWKVMLSVFVGGGLTAALFEALGMTPNIEWYEHLLLGGFCFGAVFMATDPVTGSRTETGKYIYGFLIGFIAITVRVLNPGYPEGMMMAILLMNAFAPLIDYFVVDRNISKRLRRANNK